MRRWFFNYWPIATKRNLFVANELGVTGMNFHENPFRGSRDTTEKVRCSSSKVSLIIDWSQPTRFSCKDFAWSARREFSWKSLQWKPRCSREDKLLLK